MDNKIIEVQEMLFKEMKRLDADDLMTSKNFKKEIARSTALYNQTTNFVKVINTNLKIAEISKKEGTKTKELMQYLGLENE